VKTRFVCLAALASVCLAQLSYGDCPTNRVVAYGSNWQFDLPTAFNGCTDTNVNIVVLDTVTNSTCSNSYSETRTWQVTDACSNSATCSQTITVVAPAVITYVFTNLVLNADSNCQAVLPDLTGTNYIIALDSCNGTNLTVTQNPTNGTPLMLGTNTIVLTVADLAGSLTYSTNTVVVQDVTPPIITLNGISPVYVECHTNYADAGASAVDNCSGVVAMLTNNPVDPNSPGSYTVTYTATDAAGNSATNTRTVIVQDTTPPIITYVFTNLVLNANSNCQALLPDLTGTNYIVGLDSCSGTNLTITQNPTNGTLLALGTNTVVLAVADLASNLTYSTNTVVVQDVTPPVITYVFTNLVLNADSNCQAVLPDLTGTNYIVAFDSCGGTNVTITQIPTNGTSLALGTNIVVLTVADLASNLTYSTNTVVVQDVTPPVITYVFTNLVLNADSNCQAALPDLTGSNYLVALDACSGTNLTITQIPTNGTLLALGTNTLVLTVADMVGNLTYSTNTVVVQDITPPIITLNGSNLVYVECHTGYADAGVSAIDNCSGVVGVITNNPVDPNTPGAYTVVYTATDGAGNSATNTRAVIVRDTTPPTISATNIVAAENPRDSGSAMVTFPAPVAIDTCDSAPTVVSVPPSSSTFANGYTTVTSTAQDASGNTNSCSFTVRVIPYRLYVLNTNDSGPGSLRQAMLDANASPDQNLILFNVPGAGAQVIQPLSPLPQISSPVTIDGSSQPGYAGTPLIVINGSLISTNADGLTLNVGSNTVRALALNGFTTAIRATTGGGNIIQGNFIGADATGTNAVRNLGDGIVVNSGTNLIGGLNAASANVISGNAGNGIVLASVNARNNTIQRNLIGLALGGTVPLGNGQNGIALSNQASGNLIGGNSSGANQIAFNGSNGVVLLPDAGVGNAILGNSIRSNTALGIDLGGDGPTPNHGSGTISGPNQFQNSPMLADVTSLSGVTTITGTLNSTPNQVFHLEFFLNDAADPSGFGEGKTFLGALDQRVLGDGNGDFAVPFQVPATSSQFISATATDPNDNTSEFSASFQVQTPPVLQSQPTNSVLIQGTGTNFCVTAVGTPPFFYQWRLNGANIPGATNACYTIPVAQLINGGSYSVVVVNALGDLNTTAASILLPLPALQGADMFTNRVAIVGPGGTNSGSNIGATSEPGEPLHGGKFGGKSVWYKWRPPFNGIATIATEGSDFDTLLGVYTLKDGAPQAVSNLVTVAGNDDGGSFFTSQVSFNVNDDTEFEIAVDGFSGYSGNYALSWSELSTLHMLPDILTNPVSQTVLPDATVNFSVTAVPVCSDIHANCKIPSHYRPEGVIPVLKYQWLFNETVILGATNKTLTVSNASVANVGNYTVLVIQNDRTNESKVASLQVNITSGVLQDVAVYQKYQDAFLANPLLLGTFNQSQALLAPGAVSQAVIVAGYTGTQVFNTTGGTSQGEVFCGVIGGSSEWLPFTAGQSGLLAVNTDGSSFSTLLAVVSSNSPPTVLACDVNSGQGGTNSALVVPVQAGQNYLFGVDGVNGAFGKVVLNYTLTPGTIGSAPTISHTGNTNGNFYLTITGITNKFAVQVSTDLTNWVSLVTNPAPVYQTNYIDIRSTNYGKRFYRVELVP
jgi:hypothetical protein